MSLIPVENSQFCRTSLYFILSDKDKNLKIKQIFELDSSLFLFNPFSLPSMVEIGIESDVGKAPRDFMPISLASWPT